MSENDLKKSFNELYYNNIEEEYNAFLDKGGKKIQAPEAASWFAARSAHCILEILKDRLGA